MCSPFPHSLRSTISKWRHLRACSRHSPVALARSRIHWYEHSNPRNSPCTHMSPKKLVVIGGTVETARRASVSAWNGFIDCAFVPAVLEGKGTHSTSLPTAFFLTAHFSQEDYPYDWIMHWLSKVRRVGRERGSLIPDSPNLTATRLGKKPRV